MDPLSLVGLVIGVGAILAGQFIEGGHIGSLINVSAMLIVLGGTLVAAMVQARLEAFLRAVRLLAWVVRPPAPAVMDAIERIVEWSQIARKEGLLGLEGVIEEADDPFVRKGLQLLVDGTEPDAIRDTLDVDLGARERRDLQAARLFEAMGGYSPTIGIIGAVMCLIHVMRNLADPSKLGGGIATAFVATIYGVGLANLLFLPIGNKLKGLVQEQTQYREMLSEGIVAIAEGENPRNIEVRLLGYLG